MTEKDNEILERLDDIRTSSLLEVKEVYNMREACMYLGVTRGYLYELVRKHKIPYYHSRGGKLLYFHRDDLVDWMTAYHVPSAQQVLDRL